MTYELAPRVVWLATVWPEASDSGPSWIHSSVHMSAGLFNLSPALQPAVSGITMVLQTAEEMRKIGDDTLVALEGQGRQLERMRGEYDAVDEHADRAESNLAWLGRWCWCFNCCRPEAKPQKGWGKKKFRPKNTHNGPHPRAVARNEVRISRELHMVQTDCSSTLSGYIVQLLHNASLHAVQRFQSCMNRRDSCFVCIAHGHRTRLPHAQKQQNGATCAPARPAGPPPASAVPHRQHTIGNGIDGELGEQLRKETHHQDDILDQVDQALDGVKRNAQVRACTRLPGCCVPSCTSKHSNHAEQRGSLCHKNACGNAWHQGLLLSCTVMVTGAAKSPAGGSAVSSPWSTRVQAINATLEKQDTELANVHAQSQHTHDRIRYLRRHKLLRNQT
jgi:hypothetical protein